MNREKYIEYNKSKYDDAKNTISSLLKAKMFLDRINDFNFVKQAVSYDIPDEYVEIWSELVEYVKGVRDGSIQAYVGTMINFNNKEYGRFIPEHLNSAWQVLKNNLENKEKNGKKIYTMEEIASLENGTLKILNNLSDDTSSGEAVKGMVVGYVQSGKTTSIESLISMAADWGFNVFIMLSGIIENLRVQNLNRLRHDIEYSANSNIHWEFINNPTSISPKAEYLINSDKRIVIVTLKNSKRLQNVKDWLFSSSELSLKKAKVLIIDDEADQAGLNTNDITEEERSRINGLITDLLDNHLDKLGSMNYVGYTATPYGNFLNELKSIYPKDFIYMLPKSGKYIGPQEIFGFDRLPEKQADGLNIIRNIGIKDLSELNKIELGQYNPIPESLKDAICWFICCLATFRKKNIVAPLTMLVHSNRKTGTHKELCDAMCSWIKNEKVDSLFERCERVYTYEINEFSRQDFYDVMENYGSTIDDYLPFEDLKSWIYEIINHGIDYVKNIDDRITYSRGLTSVIDNCVISSVLDETILPRLAYPSPGVVDYATGFIVIGGDTLSRGLTLEGLVTTYFCRKVNTMDTLMQMGRWFGYRTGYELMPRIWLDSTNKNKFVDLTKVESEMREDLTKYEYGITPSDYGPIISLEFESRMNITSKSKMQSAIAATYDFCGISNQTVLFDYNYEKQNDNILLTNDFIDKLENETHIIDSNTSPGSAYAANVDFSFIEDYLMNFKFCKAVHFAQNLKEFCEWIKKVEKYQKWNVVFGGTKEGNHDGWIVGKVSRSKLSRLSNEEYFSIGTLRAPIDLIADLSIDDISIKNPSSSICFELRNKYDVPQLIIYRIDGNSIPSKMNSGRERLNLPYDLIGLCINIPGVPKKDYRTTVTIAIDRKNDEENAN